MEEEWRPILGYENYEVSNFGNVKSFCYKKDGKIMKPQTNKNGYLHIIIWGMSSVKPKIFKVHRLVLQTFNPTEEDLECNHKNHIKKDNRLCNLEWVSKSQNTRYKKKREGCSSQYRGVHKTKGKWKTQCRLDGKQIHLGYFDTEQEGAKVYNDFVIKHGLQDFNILNDI